MEKSFAAMTSLYDWQSLTNLLEYGDPRIKDYFLMQSLYQPALILVTYFLFVLKLGPALMKNKQAFQLKTPILIYNFSQIIFNCYILLKIVSYTPYFSIICRAKEHIEPSIMSEIVDLHYVFMMLKLYDFLDTVFFVLRKKERQISFLHLYHHSFSFLLCWLECKYLPPGPNVPPGLTMFYGFWNTLVHIFMYYYYMLSSYVANIWWKKNLTLLQLVHQCLLLCLTIVDFLQPQCPYSRNVLIVSLLNLSTTMCLFGMFYIKVYSTTNGISKRKID